MFIQLPLMSGTLAQAIEACDGEMNSTCLSSLNESGLMRVSVGCHPPEAYRVNCKFAVGGGAVQRVERKTAGAPPTIDVNCWPSFSHPNQGAEGWDWIDRWLGANPCWPMGPSINSGSMRLNRVRRKVPRLRPRPLPLDWLQQLQACGHCLSSCSQWHFLLSQFRPMMALSESQRPRQLLCPRLLLLYPRPRQGPGPTPRPVLGVPVPSPTAASAVPLLHRRCPLLHRRCPRRCPLLHRRCPGDAPCCIGKSQWIKPWCGCWADPWWDWSWFGRGPPEWITESGSWVKTFDTNLIAYL